MSDIVPEDYDDLLEGIIILIDELIMSQPMLYAKPKFHDIIVDEVTNLIQIQLLQLLLQVQQDLIVQVHCL